MSDSEVAVDSLRDTGGSNAGAASLGILVAAALFFFATISFVVFIYIYSKWRFGPGAAARTGTDHDHGDGNNPSAIRTRGPNPDVIKSLPIVVFEPKDFKDGMECAVCLSELVEGEEARLLPKCNHGFHVQCIDMWLFSHSTCPLCRNPIGTQLEFGSDETPEVDSTDASVPEPASMPTNVLFWGTPSGTVQETHSSAVVSPATSSSTASSSSEGTLVIEIPRRELGGFPSSSEDMKSPMSSTPTPTRLRSLTRLLSRGKRVVGLVSGSPGGAVDIEQGVVGIGNGGTPKTQLICEGHEEELNSNQRFGAESAVSWESVNSIDTWN